LVGETEVLGENLPQRHFVYHKSHLPGPGSNPGRRGGKPVTNHLSYGAAALYTFVNSVLNVHRYYFFCSGMSVIYLSTGLKHCNLLTGDNDYFRRINTYQQLANGKLNSLYRTNGGNEPISRQNCLKFSNKRLSHCNMCCLRCVLISYGVILHRRDETTAKTVRTIFNTCRTAIVSTLHNSQGVRLELWPDQ
jgi:hypothetical protein